MQQTDINGNVSIHPVFKTAELQAFYAAHPDFDLLQCDFTGRRPLDERLAAVDATTLQQLKAGQRLLRLTRDSAMVQALYDRDYRSAWQVAGKSEAMFVKDLDGHLSANTAQQLYRRARGIKAHTLHLWATVHNLVASPHFRQSRINNVPAELTNYLSEMPDYEDLFGSLDYYEVEHCQSILSPSAYLVELLWYVDQYLDGPNAGTIPAGFSLDERRPDLKRIELTCANTLDTLPFLKIVNQVLRAQVVSHTTGQEPLDCLARLHYPWSLPLELPWAQVQGDLAHLQAKLAKVYRTFDDPANNSHEDLIGRAETGLSQAIVNLVTTPISDEAELKALYGLDTEAEASLAITLEDRDRFLQQTGLTRPQLLALLHQDLTQDERDAGLAHQLYINQTLTNDAVELTPVADSTDETLSLLTNAVLDRLRRLVYLTKVLGSSFSEVDTALRALGINSDSDISSATLNALGRLRTLQQQYKLPLDTLCALFADMNTIGVGDPKQPVALFDRVYNHATHAADEVTYHPSYTDNSLYTQTPVTWNTDGATSDETQFSGARLATSLRLSQGDLKALREALWPNAEQPPLDVPNLSRLYRNTLLMQQLGYPLADYSLLMSLLELPIDNSNLLGNEPLPALQSFEHVLDTAAWLARLGWTVRHLDYILNGNEYADVSTLIPVASIPERMAAFWAQELPTVPPDVAQLTTEQTAQLQHGLALFFGMDTELFPGLAHWVEELTGIHNYLHLLYTPPPFPVQYWQLDEGGGATLANEISDLDGTLQGEAAWGKADDFPGGARSVLRLNGEDNYVDLEATANELGLVNSSFTVQAWVKLDELPPPDFFAPILGSDGTESVANKVLTLSVGSDGKVAMDFSSNQTRSDASLDLGEWKHLIWRYDKDEEEQAIFIDGVMNSISESGRTALQSSDNMVNIGKQSMGGNPSLFKGHIAELRIWSEALTAEQIEQNFDAYTDNTHTEDWERIITFLTHLSRYRLLATDAGVSGRQFDSMAVYPDRYGIGAVFDGPEASRQLSMLQLRTLVDFRALVTAIGDSEEEQLVAYLEDVVEGRVNGVPTRAGVLSPITGWSASELEALVNASPPIGYAGTLGTAAGLLRLDSAFTLMQAMGSHVLLIEQLIALGSATANNDSGQAVTTATAVRHLVTSKYAGEKLDEVVRKLDDPLDELERDAMAPWLIWTLNNQWETNDIDHKLNNFQDLSEYLLLDVEMQGSSENTPIKQAHLSLQMYIQRCQMGLETGVTPIDVDNQQWAWLLDYRLWEANRKIFLYPENFLEPTLRTDKSAEFARLENALQQGELNDERIETAFRDYFHDFETLARLQIVETARYRVESTVGSVDTLFVFGRAATEPPTFYYRRCTDPGLAQPVWHYWEKIEVQINAPTVMPAYAFSRLFLFWAEHKEITKTESNNTKTTEVQVTIRYSFLNAHGKWIAPQTLVADYVPEESPGMPVSVEEIKDNPFWQRPYALVAPLDDPDDEAGEQILVSLGEILNNNGLLNSDGSTTENPHTWRLTAELLPEQTELKFLSSLFPAPLSQARANLAATTVNTPEGERAIFAGGNDGRFSLAVDIYGYQEDEWIHHSSVNNQIPELSRAKSALAATTLTISTDESWAIFAGGVGTNEHFNTVDAYQCKGGEWIHDSSVNNSIPILSQARGYLVATTLSTSEGERAIFAGGQSSTSQSATLDIYGYQAGEWTHDSTGDAIPGLAKARRFLAAATLTTPENWAIFAGGEEVEGNSATVDAYQFKNARWIHHSSVSDTNENTIPELSQARSNLAATTLTTSAGESWAIFAGGGFVINNAFEELSTVDAYQYKNGQWIHHSSVSDTNEDTIPALSRARSNLAATTLTTSTGESWAIFVGGIGNNRKFNTVDAYHYKDGRWIHHFSDDNTIPELSQATGSLAVTAINTDSIALFAGGRGDENSNISDTVFTYKYLRADNSVVNVPSQYISNDRNQLCAAVAENRLADNYHNDYISTTNTIPNNKKETLLNNLPTVGHVSSVKNQSGWSVLHYGRRAFLSQSAPGVMDTSVTIKEASIADGNKPLAADSNSHTGGWDPLANPRQQFLFTRLTTSVVQRFMQRLFSGGLDHLLNLDSQRTPEFDLNRFGPTNLAVVPDANHLDFNGAYGPYYWEIFYHVPTLVAAALNAQQHFAEAKHWYEYVFEPTSQDEAGLDAGNETQRVWQFLPFRNYTLQTLDEILGNEQQLRTAMQQPFDPHALAELRIGAYEKVVVMRYIDTLLEWGDHYFAQDSRESINRATILYFLASDILGPKPRRLGNAPLPEGYPKTYTDLKPELNTASVAVEHLEQMVATSAMEMEANGVLPLENITSYFGVNENQEFIGYWDRVEDRLFKIRHGLNIEGVERELALFQPPVDPAQLVAATAAGSGQLGFPSAGAVPHYRFDAILARARNMTSNLIQLGNSLLATLEKRDAEALARLQSSQQPILLQLITQTKEQQIEAAEANLLALQRGLEAAQYRQQHYEGLLAAGLSAGERDHLVLLAGAEAFMVTASLTHGLSIAGHLLPDTFGLADGGMDFGKSIETVAGLNNSLAASVNQQASITATTAGYARRSDDWHLQADLAQHDAAQIEQQIASAQIAIAMAQSELEVHEKSLAQAQEVETFYRSKYTNQELYQWMLGQLSTAYYQCYQIALSLGSQAEQAYQYELSRTDTYLRTDYWDSLRQGLTAGEQLLWGLDQLEKAYLDNNERDLEVERTISLHQCAPEALAELKQDGKCIFSLCERLFDQDYPGQYCRQIKTLSVSIPALIGPYQDIKATLTQTANKVLMQPDIDGVQYLLGIDGAEQPDTSTLRQDWRPTQQIALSRGLDDSGQFMLNFQDERYLPFEGTGAVSDWILEMPRAANPIDFNSITDVIIHLRYMALYDADLQKDVVDLPEIQDYDGTLYLSLRQFAPAAWAAFVQNTTPANVDLALTKALLPPNVTDPQLSPASIRTLFKEGQRGTPAWTLNDGTPVEGDGTFSAAPLFASNTLTLTAGVTPDQLQDVVLIVPFSGKLAW